MDPQVEADMAEIQQMLAKHVGVSQHNLSLPADPPFIAQMQQPLLQQQVYPVAPSTSAHMVPDQYLGHFAGQDAFEAPQAVAPQQPAKRLGRPPKPKVENVGPKRKPGRPAGAVDPKPRLRRGDKQKMSPEEKKAWMAKEGVAAAASSRAASTSMSI